MTVARPASASFDDYVAAILSRYLPLRSWVVEDLYRRWTESANEGDSFLDFLTEAGVLDRVSARAIWLAWQGSLDERDTRQLFDTEATQTALRRLTLPVAPPRNVLPVGAKLGRYRIKGLLGWGANGAVYLGSHPTLAVPVAIKVMETDDELWRDRLRREARLQATLLHPCIVRVWDFDEENDRAYLVLEYVPGESLRERLDDGPLTHFDAFQMAAQAVIALRVAHRSGITHHDVKPANLLRSPDGGYKLGDFGLARRNPFAMRVISGQGRSIDGPGAGTMHYMAPEQFEIGADHRADIYGLGMTLYHVLAGSMAIREDDPDRVMIAHKSGQFEPLHLRMPTIPRPISELVRRMTDPDPERRYGDYAELLAAMERAFDLKLERF